MTADPAALRRALADQLHTAGALTDPAWRTAVESVPRELFLDTALFRQTGAQWAPVRRIETGPEEWLRLVYTDATWVTQVDGIEANQAPGPVSGNPTSSSTLPSLVVRTLEAAGIADGGKVLEIGTGTGYSTAILCHRLGEDRVTSIEYDPALAHRAADHLTAAGYHPTLITGDGLQGYKDGAEYDAIVATCAVRHIPPSWLWQLADHGSITTTLSGWMMASGLIRLTLTDDGTARGRFTAEPISYMLARPHERPPPPTPFPPRGPTPPTPPRPP
ncbi:MAG: methyltransferase domain-containing protein, partial [Streptomycetaceae bacterium]|nr:methyltransferase domain-containing protein [Streptomycetaceae bacterium]